MSETRHILSLSGGKDSAALAVYMAKNYPDLHTSMEYIFHDSGKELPETYQYIAKLQRILGKPVTKTTPTDIAPAGASILTEDDPLAPGAFDHFLLKYGGMIPSNHRRWCTRMLKLKPFEDYVGSAQVVNYVGLRADEEREGLISTKPNIRSVYPFRDDGLVYEDIVEILQTSGLGMPPYTEWGRTRSGCFFCFYQQKIEWISLRDKYPELFEKAKEYEEASEKTGNPFYWSGKEPLRDMEKPERMAEIRREAEERRAQKAKSNKLWKILGPACDDDEQRESGCLICQI